MSARDEPTRLFVYGTLKRGFPNHAEYLGVEPVRAPVLTVKRYPLLITGPSYVPCLMNAPGRGRRVVGELYEVDGETLARLDELEEVGRPWGYYRATIEVAGSEAGAVPIEAATYFKDDPSDPVHATDLGEYVDRRYRPGTLAPPGSE